MDRRNIPRVYEILLLILYAIIAIGKRTLPHIFPQITILICGQVLLLKKEKAQMEIMRIGI